MKHLNFYLDFHSPEVCQVFEHLPQALLGCSYSVRYWPVWLAKDGPLPPAQDENSPLALIYQALARSDDGQPNRYVCETVFQHAECDGLDTQDPDVQLRLKANSNQAMALGVVGVPTIEVDGKLFCGLGALPALADFVR